MIYMFYTVKNPLSYSAPLLLCVKNLCDLCGYKHTFYMIYMFYMVNKQ